METVVLQQVSESTSPSAAISILRKSGQTALIIQKADGCSLAWASDLADGIQNGISKTGFLPNLAPVYAIKNSDINTYGLDLANPKNTSTEYERLLDASGHMYALINAPPNEGLVLTRHERLLDYLTGSTLECDGPTTHAYPQPQQQVGDDCPRCPMVNGRQPKLHLAT